MAHILFPNPFKPALEIKRYPFKENDLLQGFDSADELILSHLKSLDLTSKKILILNDEFGALSLALEEFNPVIYTDSFISYQGILNNSGARLKPLHDLNDLKDSFDIVLIKLPKNLSFFEDELATLTNLLHPESEIICGGMVKHMASGCFDLLNKYIGETKTSLAQKKARLIFCKFEKHKFESPYPKKLKIENFDLEFIHHSNLFSREKLDIGTRFFLEHLPVGDFAKIVDLGCANGIVGIKAKLLNPKSEIIFTDESFMAIKSAEINFKNQTSASSTYVWTNCYENQSPASVDLVLCNPPFHQQTTIGDFIAWQMFQDSLSALKSGGKIRVIGNSHLGYHVKLKKLFGNSKIIATNPKFMIVEAQKS